MGESLRQRRRCFPIGVLVAVLSTASTENAAQVVLGEYRGSGGLLAALGDIDRDGVTDILVGNSTFDIGNLSNVGTAYILSGRTGGRLFELFGKQRSERVGTAVLGPGDVDGDGWPDFVIGTSVAFSGLTLYSGRSRAAIVSFPQRWLAAAPGDVNRDGRADLFIGDPCAFVPSISKAGAAEAVSLSRSPGGESRPGGGVPADPSVGGVATPTTLYAYQGSSAFEGLGLVAWAGDVNADDVPDLLLGAAGAFPNGSPNGAYVYSGRTGAQVFYLPPLSGTFPRKLSGVGDVNADGFDGVAVHHIDTRFGTQEWWIDLFAGPNGTKIHTLQSPTPKPDIGTTLVAPGDVDGDGHDDVLTSGNVSTTSQVLLFSGRDGSALFTLSGGFSTETVSETAALGDFNDDGFPDYLVGGVDHTTSNTPFIRVYSGAPLGVSTLGRGCPGESAVVPRIGASHVPSVGSRDFSINLSRVRTGGVATLVLGSSAERWRNQSLPIPLSSLGPACALLSSPDILLPIRIDGIVEDKGWIAMPLPIPEVQALRGATLFAQWLVPSAAGGGSGGASRALQITIQ